MKINVFKSAFVHQNTAYIGTVGESVMQSNDINLIKMITTNDNSVIDLINTELLKNLKACRFIIDPSSGDTKTIFSRTVGYFSHFYLNPQNALEDLLKKKVCILGLGGTGSQMAYLLAASGIGSLILCDYDTIEIHNLNRQILYSEQDVGRLKTEVAHERLKAIFPNVNLQMINAELSSPDQVGKLIADADFVVRCIDSPTDIFKTVEESCKIHDKPLINGGFIDEWGIVGPIIIPTDHAEEGKYALLQHLSLNPERKTGTFPPLTFIISGCMATEIIAFLLKLKTSRLLDSQLYINGITGERFYRKLDRSIQ